MTRFLGNVIRWFFVLVWIVVIVAFMYLRAHGSTGKQARTPEPDWFINYHEYSYGTVGEITILHMPNGKTWTGVLWKPAMTPLLYTEDLSFCGNVAGKFEGLLTTDSVVLIFSRAREVARIEGPKPNIVACRTLDAVVRKTDNP